MKKLFQKGHIPANKGVARLPIFLGKERPGLMPTTDPEGLTTKQRTVFECLKTLMCRKEIATFMGHSDSATRHLITEVYYRMGLHSRQELWLKYGMLGVKVLDIERPIIQNKESRLSVSAA